MPIFSYAALNNVGREERGQVTASSVNDAVTQLRERGYFPTSVVEASDIPSKPACSQARPTAGTVPDIHAHIEMNRAFLKLGFSPSELQGADPTTWEDTLVIYKVLFDWIRSRRWVLSAQDIQDIESAIHEKIPNYTTTSFDPPSP